MVIKLQAKNWNPMDNRMIDYRTGTKFALKEYTFADFALKENTFADFALKARNKVIQI